MPKALWGLLLDSCHKVVMENHYHPTLVEGFETLPLSKQRIINDGRYRPLTSWEFKELERRDGWLDSSAFYARRAYCQMISWSCMTEGFINDFWYFLALRGIKKIVEPYAGKATLRRFARKPFMTWECYDACPVTDDVKRGSAREVMKALRPGDAEVILVSWVPYRDEEDLALLEASRRLQIPILWIGELRYGCTGSDKFWKTLNRQEFQVDYHEHGVEVENWDGIHDQFIVITPPPPRRPPRVRKTHNLKPRRAKVRRA